MMPAKPPVRDPLLASPPAGIPSSRPGFGVPRSLCDRLSLVVQESRGIIKDRGGYLVVQTPESPTFWFGNYLLLASVPGPGTLAFWETRFQEEMGTVSGHRLFILDCPEGSVHSVPEFEAAGYVFERTRSMVLELAAPGTPGPPGPPSPPGPSGSSGPSASSPLTPVPPAAELFPVELDAAGVLEFSRLSVLRFRSDPSSFPDADEEYLEAQGRLNARLVETGKAAFFALMDGKEFLSTVLFILGQGEALIRDVETAPKERRKGYCRKLLALTIRILAERGFVRFALEPVDEYAASIYRWLGFVDGDWMCDLLHRPHSPGQEPGNQESVGAKSDAGAHSFFGTQDSPAELPGGTA